MDFDLSSDQIALRDAASALLDKYSSMDRVRLVVGEGEVVGTLPGAVVPVDSDSKKPIGRESTPNPAYDLELWRAMADQGWLGIEVEEEDGGLEMGMVEVAVLCEQIGRHLAPAPFLSSVLCLGAVRDALKSNTKDALGDSVRNQLNQWCVALSTGEAIGAVVWIPETQSSSTLDSRPQDAANATVLLSGRVGPTTYSASADLVVIVQDKIGVFLVSSQDLGVRSKEPAMDRTRELGWIDLDSTPALTIGDSDSATRILDRAATATAAEMLGTAERALEMAVEYARDRVQFGKPIGSFQAIKHMLADALVDVEGMRSTVYYGGWCTATNDPESSLAASMAKSWGSDASRRVLATALQVHGGIGFTWEHDMHLYLKRAQLDQVSFGDGPWHRDRIASLLHDRIENGQSVL